MLPTVPATNITTAKTRKVYINPNFKVATQLSSSSVSAQQLEALIYQQQQQQQQQQQHFQKPQQCYSAIQQPSIHINPHFLQRKFLEQQNQQLKIVHETREYLQRQHQEQEAVTWAQTMTGGIQERVTTTSVVSNNASMPVDSAKIISKASTKLVRKAPEPKANLKVPSPAAIVPSPAPLISLSKRKLIRQVNTPALFNKTSKKTTSAGIVTSQKHQTTDANKYKIDRRCRVTNVSLKPLVKLSKKRTFVGRYALRRVTEHAINKKLRTVSSFMPSKPVSNRTLQLLNINGVLYKSTRNKLQRKISTSSIRPNGGTLRPVKDAKVPAVPFSGRTLFVHGTKFVMDIQGFKLTRQPGHSSISHLPSASVSAARQRIDIGGMTYLASSSIRNVFVRTSNHVSRAHLLTAKQRSLQMLNRSLAKTNIPCGIYQRLGKCAAHESGKCRKVHDKRQIAICPRFLRGECRKTNCLLSHSVTLAKMPVCKFYLKALCVRDDCPYLHKKLNENAEICVEFLRGYCPLAEKCNKRHEFICPEYERKGKCEITNCVQCAQMRYQAERAEKRRLLRAQKKKLAKDAKEVSKLQQKCLEKAATITNTEKEDDQANRYFDARLSSNEDMCESAIDDVEKATSVDVEDDNSEYADEDLNEEVQPVYKTRAKLGTLPSFIPFS